MSRDPTPADEAAHDVLAAEEFALPVPDPSLRSADDELAAAHDVLAAEEFALPAPDPSLEPAHDVLAAEEFALPAPDPSLHRSPVVLPEDPYGGGPPHDVLAAEEFAMPAPWPRSVDPLAQRRGPSWRRALPAGLCGLLALCLLRRVFRRH